MSRTKNLEACARAKEPKHSKTPSNDWVLGYTEGDRKGFRTGLMTGILGVLGGFVAAAAFVSFLFGAG